MKRILYLLNIETGEETEHVDVTEMREPDILKLEQQLWAKLEDPWVVKDTQNAISAGTKKAPERKGPGVSI